MSSELIRCVVNAWGFCVSEYDLMFDDLADTLRNFNFEGVFWHLIFPFLVSGLLSTFLYWGTGYLERLLEKRMIVDPEEYMDGFERLFEPYTAELNYSVRETAAILQPEAEATSEVKSGSDTNELQDTIMDGLLELDTYRQKNRSQYDVGLKLTGRQLGNLVRQRITWLMTLESSRIPDFTRNRSAVAVPASLPAASKVVIEDVTDSDLDSGDSDSDPEVELIPKLGYQPVSGTDTDSDSDTGDFCVIPKNHNKW